ncbi:MAG TPA: bifunctional diaminohydroxyphosphoribosylaminopyrimidine deaminase/5-amino-6-(5-phosphoribosylamino)uracil reductase RibD [Cyclobacteriaceae bacterium]|nr:bifunctional diaminohydroxyphosphoribosylaminopyrimidine deaminase/5-amino-6-(5-phosphoribosylamino)uracil reductase RibD [Cyclobacteriaceae bacterium]
MDKDAQFMLRALELAVLGQGAVSPNPMVGCVIVHEDRIIGEGYHEKYGEAHAEPNAIRKVADPSLLAEATLYVSLEPCAHYGKTAPCAQLLVEKKLKRVVVAVQDPNPMVGGKGVRLLRDAGIEVKLGVLERQATHLNRRFFTQMVKQRPFVILKWAQTADGFVARTDYSSKWISNAHSRQMVHRWRAEEDAILVGTKTAHFDNPKLNVRHWTGKNPVRIVIDRRLTLDPNLSLFDQTQPTICYNLVKAEETNNITWVKLEEDFDVEDILEDLNRRKVQSLIVEGGSLLLQLLISRGAWDEARVFTGNIRFGNGIPAPHLLKSPHQTLDVMGDKLSIYRNS